MKKHFIDDWHWVLNHSWSMRLIILASVLSGAEAIIPLFTADPPLPRALFAALSFSVTAGAFVARLLVQNHEDPNGP